MSFSLLLLPPKGFRHAVFLFSVTRRRRKSPWYSATRNLLRLEVDCPGVEALEDQVDAALFVFRFVLSYDRCVHDAVVESASVLCVQVEVPLVGKLGLDVV